MQLQVRPGTSSTPATALVVHRCADGNFVRHLHSENKNQMLGAKADVFRPELQSDQNT